MTTLALLVTIMGLGFVAFGLLIAWCLARINRNEFSEWGE